MKTDKTDKMNETKYGSKKPYYKIKFLRCVSPEYDYTIVPEMKDARDYLEHEVEMDEDSSVIITKIMVTDKQYEKFIKLIET